MQCIILSFYLKKASFSSLNNFDKQSIIIKMEDLLTKPINFLFVAPEPCLTRIKHPKMTISRFVHNIFDEEGCGESLY